MKLWHSPDWEHGRCTPALAAQGWVGASRPEGVTVMVGVIVELEARRLCVASDVGPFVVAERLQVVTLVDLAAK